MKILIFPQMDAEYDQIKASWFLAGNIIPAAVSPAPFTGGDESGSAQSAGGSLPDGDLVDQ